MRLGILAARDGRGPRGLEQRSPCGLEGRSPCGLEGRSPCAASDERSPCGLEGRGPCCFRRTQPLRLGTDADFRVADAAPRLDAAQLQPVCGCYRHVLARACVGTSCSNVQVVIAVCDTMRGHSGHNTGHCCLGSSACTPVSTQSVVHRGVGQPTRGR